MAEQETMNQRSELRETAVAAEGCAIAQMEMLDMCLKCIEECMEGVQKLSSPKFNNKQCDYLADKLKVVAPSARSFLEASRVELHEPGSSVDMARHIEIFKLMLRLAKEIESFILGCSRDEWIQAAMTLTNMSDYVASIGFNLELCRVAFCKECPKTGFTGRLALDQIMDINNDEVKLVKEKALVDVETLFSKVLTELTKKSLSKEENELAIYLLQRLKRVGAISPSVASGSSWCSVTNDESFLGNLFKWVSLGERLGKGATATVYKVMWLGTSAAKKTFPGRENPDFMKEVKVLAGLSHPNIMSMFCCEKNKRSCSLIMELMDEDLHDLMLKRCGDSNSPPFTIFEAVDIMLQISEGVNYLHQKGFVHRDLKSLNILVKSVLAIQSKVEVGYVLAKVADFGLSKTKNFTTTYSNQTSNTGTFRWMAPEVIVLDGKSHGNTSSQPKYPAKCDVFSFAMLCYEILTGDLPFPCETLPRRIKQQIMNGIRPDLPGDCPHELKALIAECWSAMPKQRPSFPTICSKLKYLKYLLMTGFSSNEPIGEPLQASTTVRSHTDLTMIQEISKATEVQAPGVPAAQAAPHGSDSLSSPVSGFGTMKTLELGEQEPEHKIFLSYSGAQKSFVEQLNKDLEALDYSVFFDLDNHMSAKGQDFNTHILDVAKRCHVAVVVLSREYLSSKWPMHELAEFVRAMGSENKSLKLVPLFYKASTSDLSEESIQYTLLPIWEKFREDGARVDLEDWAMAVRTLRRVNGLRFYGPSEVKYRDDIVNAIVQLMPPNFLYDTSTIFGYDRICKILADKFQRDTRTSAEVLGLYGTGGMGKTIMSKSLCNYFNKEFLGRVCLLEMNERIPALERQKMVMKKLLSFGHNHSSLLHMLDVSQGWKILQAQMKRYPVFLVIDNVQPQFMDEARGYLNLEYNLRSKIMVISRSRAVVEELLGDDGYCWEIPCLTRDEAAGIFLYQGAPWRNYSSLSFEEHKVVESFLEEARFSNHSLRGENRSYEREAGHYHPLVLRALGDYFRERNKTADVLSWGSDRHGYATLKGITEYNRHVFETIGMQISTLDRRTQLMFLDVVLYARETLEFPMLSNSPLEDLIVWLANVHRVPRQVAQSKRFGVINVNEVDTRDHYLNEMEVDIYDIYKEHASWFLGQLNLEELLGVWCVGDSNNLVTSLPLELQPTPPGRCWPGLERIRLECIGCYDFSVEKFQEWRNIVVLQIVECNNLTTINLHELTCLRHLELKNLKSLETLAFTAGMQYLRLPLQFVKIDGLDSLERLPSFSDLTSLKFLEVLRCYGLTQPPSVEHCSCLERLWLEWHPQQGTLPSLYGLTSLRDLTIEGFQGLPYKGKALNLEGLFSLTSLGALELRNIPVGDLSGLEVLSARLEYVQLVDLRFLTSLRSLDNLARSDSLHVLEVTGCNSDALEGLDEVQSVMKLKLARLAEEGKIVPHTPSKIWIPRLSD